LQGGFAWVQMVGWKGVLYAQPEVLRRSSVVFHLVLRVFCNNFKGLNDLEGLEDYFYKV